MKKQINRPVQKRSQQTMVRMLEAAEALLEEKSWQSLTIQEVVTQANCSVGAFYGRFKDKNGLLHALDERYFAAIIGQIETAVSVANQQPHTLQETINLIAQLVVNLHAQKQGLMRTLILQARLEDEPRFREREGRLMSYFPKLIVLLMVHQDQIAHEEAETAVRFGLLQLFYTAREMMIWPHLASTMPHQGASLAAALAHTLHSYLQTPPPPT